MPHFDQRNQRVNRQTNVNHQTNIKISSTKKPKLSQIQKIYHWANLIAIPIILLIILTADGSTDFGEYIVYVGLGYLVVSGLFNDMTRVWIFKFFENLFKAGCALGWLGPAVGIVLSLFLVIAVGVVGVFILMAALWIISLIAIIQDNSN